MKLTGRQYGIIIATLTTAIMHIAAALDKQIFTHGPDPLSKQGGGEPHSWGSPLLSGTIRSKVLKPSNHCVLSSSGQAGSKAGNLVSRCSLKP